MGRKLRTIIVTARIGDRTVKANGREAQALLALVDAGNVGITSLDMGRAGWAIRLAAYIGDLRKMGVPIITEREAHDGGHHGRYKIEPVGAVHIIERYDLQQKEAA